jgi:hypothetical protein
VLQNPEEEGQLEGEVEHVRYLIFCTITDKKKSKYFQLTVVDVMGRKSSSILK